MTSVPMAPAEKRSAEPVAMATGADSRHGHWAAPSPPDVRPQEKTFWDVMEVLLFIAAGSRCTLVGMNKRRAGGEINNEDGELKLEAAGRERACVCTCLISLNSSSLSDLGGKLTLLFIRINFATYRSCKI